MPALVRIRHDTSRAPPRVLRDRRHPSRRPARTRPRAPGRQCRARRLLSRDRDRQGLMSPPDATRESADIGLLLDWTDALRRSDLERLAALLDPGVTWHGLRRIWPA